MTMNPGILKRQAAICLALVREIDRLAIEEHRPADQALNRVYRRHPEYGARDRNFYSNAVFSWFRWRGWLKTPNNAHIALAILLDASEIPPQIDALLEGSTLSQSDLQAAGSLTIEAKSEYLQNLRRLGRDASPYLLEFLSSDLVPSWFFDFAFVPEEKDRNLHFKQCIEAFQARPPVWLRLPLGREEKTLEKLIKAGYEIELHPLLKQTVFIKGPKKFDASQFPSVEMQDLASQCVGLCCNPRPGEAWWDMCAGSGGKSLHLADLTHDRGSILAADIRNATLDQLAKRLKKNKYRSIKSLLWDGKSLPGKWPGRYFDGILVDAPCSGLGTWHRNPDARWRVDAGQIKEYARIQQGLLEIAAPKLKTGGRLVYATCTLTKMENMDVVSAFLEQHHKFRLEELVNPLNRKTANGIIWIWPWERYNGMFIAVMKKT